MKERDFDNDNEPLSFLTLRAATQNVVRYLSTEDHPPRGEDRPADNKGDQKPEKNPNAPGVREEGLGQRAYSALYVGGLPLAPRGQIVRS